MNHENLKWICLHLAVGKLFVLRLKSGKSSSSKPRFYNLLCCCFALPFIVLAHLPALRLLHRNLPLPVEFLPDPFYIVPSQYSPSMIDPVLAGLLDFWSSHQCQYYSWYLHPFSLHHALSCPRTLSLTAYFTGSRSSRKSFMVVLFCVLRSCLLNLAPSIHLAMKIIHRQRSQDKNGWFISVED